MNSFQFIQSLEFLKFRRQFLLGPSDLNMKGWHIVTLQHDYFLYVHPSLHFRVHFEEKRCAVVIGEMIDALNPEVDTSQIIKIICHASSVMNAISLTRTLAGRWIVILQIDSNSYIWTDPCGLRQVYYYSAKDKIVCGSTPEIIKKFYPLEYSQDEDLLEFIHSEEFAKNEYFWVGDTTWYRDCMHLLPNHYLDLNSGKSIRFFPTKEIGIERAREIDVANFSSGLIENIILGLTEKKKVLQALTAGIDSRVLLACSRKVSNSINYFVDKHGILSDRHPDVWIPRKISQKFNLNFNIYNSKNSPPNWFFQILSYNVTGARCLPKTNEIYTHYVFDQNMIKVNGNGSEICRNFYDKYNRFENEIVSKNWLAKVIGYEQLDFAIKQISAWLEDLGDNWQQVSPHLNILDLFYWEQRMGNWGAQYPAEQDIAIEEISPFNCRILIETISQAPREKRSAPNYTIYQEIIKNKWPDLLSLPVNPHKYSTWIQIKNGAKKLLKGNL